MSSSGYGQTLRGPSSPLPLSLSPTTASLAIFGESPFPFPRSPSVFYFCFHRPPPQFG